MSPIRALLPLLLANALTAPAVAQPNTAERSESYHRCMTTGDAARGIVTAIDICAATEQAIQDVRLSDAYDRAMDRLGLWRQVELYNSQADWRSASDRRCVEIAGTDRRGNSSGRTFNLCLLDETIDRAAWLESYSAE